MKCDKCGGESFTLVASRLQGLNKLIDVYHCRTCHTSKQVIIETEPHPSTPDPFVDVDNDGDFDYEPLDNEPDERDPFDDDGGWDPSIG